jgi:hypothetical protein
VDYIKEFLRVIFSTILTVFGLAVLGVLAWDTFFRRWLVGIIWLETWQVAGITVVLGLLIFIIWFVFKENN